jgi:hypothetical protein
MSIKTSANLQPRCDLHRDTQMVPVVLENVRQGFKAPVDGCNVPGCKRHYDPDDGYFDVVNGKLLVGHSKAAPVCREHEAFLYLDTYGSSEEIWRCPAEGCPTEKKLSATEA